MDCAESILRTAAAAGIDTCFANAGTTEMPFITALDRVPAIRPVLCFFEGGCTGAAEGYARMTGRPALALLHGGPGLANASSNLHNARRGEVPLVTLIGDQPTWHRPYDPLLHSDIGTVAAFTSDWVRSVEVAGTASAAMAEAVAAALRPPGRISHLVLPLDMLWFDGEAVAAPIAPAPARPVPADAVEAAARALKTGAAAALLLRGPVLWGEGLRLAARVRAATGCRLLCDTFVPRVDRGRGLPIVERIPYFPREGMAAIADLTDLVVCGGREPVAFFGYPGLPSVFAPDGCRRHRLAAPGDDSLAALRALADALDAPLEPSPDPDAAIPAPPAGAAGPAAIGAALAHVLPEGAIIVDESITGSAPIYQATAGAAPHSYLLLAGGAIGWGITGATGAAIACPDRPVINVQADGSGMYTLQCLWTQARENLNVTTVILANNTYEIIRIELARAGIEAPGPAARALAEFKGQPLDWVSLARGHGVPGVRVDSADALIPALRRAIAAPGPNLIEARF